MNLLRRILVAGLLLLASPAGALAENPDGRPSLTLMVSGARTSSSSTYTITPPSQAPFEVQPTGTHGGFGGFGLLTLPVKSSLSLLVMAEYKTASPKVLSPAAGFLGQDGNGYWQKDQEATTFTGSVGIRIFFGQ
jgi:hypothetical protein